MQAHEPYVIDPKPREIADRITSGLRPALLLGFIGILCVFVIAAVEAIHLLRDLQAENRILRTASAERSRSLASIRSFLALSNTYFDDYMLDPDALRSSDHRNQLDDVWTRMESALKDYRTNTLDERILIEQLHQLLRSQHDEMVQAISRSDGPPRHISASIYIEQIFPFRSEVVDITERVQTIDSRQIASTESEIEQQFDGLGRRLMIVLIVALGAALLLALGCLAYILRIERQSNDRYHQIQRARSELERLSARLLAAHEDERRSISRELHDEVGQTLSAVLVDAANLAQRISPGDKDAENYLNAIRSHADASLNSIRDIALLLRPSMLDDLGLVPALEWQAREVSRRGNVQVRVLAEHVPDSLDDAVRTAVYRFVQEGLHNVSRHSQASKATVTVRAGGSALTVTVEDDGVGFNPLRSRGLGLVGMEERIRQLHGKFRIQSNPGKGTVVAAELPLGQAVNV